MVKPQTPGSGKPPLSTGATPSNLAFQSTMSPAASLLFLLLALITGCGGNSSSSGTPPVQPVPATITWATPSAISYGTPLAAAQLNATANTPGTFTYTPALGTVLNAGLQPLSVAFVPTDSTHYSASNAGVTLTVNQSAPTLGWTTPAPIAYQTPLSSAQLDATASIAGTFTYTPATGTILDAGLHTLSASFTPTDSQNYASATVQAQLTVTPLTPAITWPTPTPVAVGTRLSATQLDAVARVPGQPTPLPGSYLYSPGDGTSLTTAGTETLHVQFTPADSVNYLPVQASVSLTVNSTSAAIVAWGDSLTYGKQDTVDPTDYPSDLAALLTIPVVNQGVPSQSSTQIGVRQSGIPTTVTVSGGLIPASGSVPITFAPGHEAFAPAGVPGTILGIPGTAGMSGSVYSFTRAAAGNPVPAAGTLPFVVDRPYASDIPVFWEGRNNFRLGTTTTITDDIAAQVATVPPGTDYLVLSITNNNVPEDWKGAAEYDEIIAFDQQLASTYGAHFLDVRQALVAAWDPNSILDASDHAHDEPPTSVRAFIGKAVLVNPISPSDTTFDVKLTQGYLQNLFILTIGSGANQENVSIVSFKGSTVTVIRNFGGNNTAHTAGEPVIVTDKTHLNEKGYQVVAKAVAAHFSQYAR